MRYCVSPVLHPHVGNVVLQKIKKNTIFLFFPFGECTKVESQKYQRKALAISHLKGNLHFVYLCRGQTKSELALCCHIFPEYFLRKNCCDFGGEGPFTSCQLFRDTPPHAVRTENKRKTHFPQLRKEREKKVWHSLVFCISSPKYFRLGEERLSFPPS